MQIFVVHVGPGTNTPGILRDRLDAVDSISSLCGLALEAPGVGGGRGDLQSVRRLSFLCCPSLLVTDSVKLPSTGNVSGLNGHKL